MAVSSWSSCCHGRGRRGHHACHGRGRRGHHACHGRGRRGHHACHGRGRRGHHACHGRGRRGHHACHGRVVVVIMLVMACRKCAPSLKFSFINPWLSINETDFAFFAIFSMEFSRKASRS